MPKKVVSPTLAECLAEFEKGQFALCADGRVVRFDSEIKKSHCCEQ